MTTESAHGRPRCSVFIAISADGYIARTDDSLDWLGVVQTDGEDYGYARFMDSIDVLVMGRRTYQTALGFDSWPYSGKRCVVMTRSSSLESRHGEEFFSGRPHELLAQLEDDDARRLYIDGGSIIRAFLAARLIDDLTLSIVPIVLGTGIRLFDGDLPEQILALEACRSYPSGLVQVTYRVERSEPARPAP